MWVFFTSQGALPDDYFECFLCDSLNITLEELNRQDAEWVTRMITYLSQKHKADEHKQKSANSATR